MKLKLSIILSKPCKSPIVIAGKTNYIQPISTNILKLFTSLKSAYLFRNSYYLCNNAMRQRKTVTKRTRGKKGWSLLLNSEGSIAASLMRKLVSITWGGVKSLILAIPSNHAIVLFHIQLDTEVWVLKNKRGKNLPIKVAIYYGHRI